jgi:riboflavin kinase/FMN adenylyltransferase
LQADLARYRRADALSFLFAFERDLRAFAQPVPGHASPTRVMRVINGIDRYPPGSAPVVASIGNFDGVHRGHRAILDAIRHEANSRAARALLISFDPHPLEIVAPERRPRLLQTRRQKIAELRLTGLNDLLLLRFDQALAALDADAFFTSLLLPRVPLTSIHVGESFRFGRGRAGDLARLRDLGSCHRFSVQTVPEVHCGTDVISSSVIRSAVAAGAVERAAELLGRPYAISGMVVKGEGRGATLGFPTANLDVENEILPHPGVYVTEMVALARRLPAMTNVGVRPTWGDEPLVVETHALDIDEDLYDERIELRFLARLRDERRFASGTALADQLAQDRAASEAYFQSVRWETR